MPRRLKVFRTPIGFHDAYVAAPSQKAALEAWGSDANLFARGVAEEVTDEKLMEEPLAHPGEVVRVLRGSTAEHLAALPPTPASQRRTEEETSRPARKAAPRPKRDELDAAEAAFASAERRFDEERRDLQQREAALAKEKAELERRRSRELDRLTTDRGRAAVDYRRALDAWRA